MSWDIAYRTPVPDAPPPDDAPAYFTAMSDKQWLAVAGSGRRITNVTPAFIGGGSPVGVCEAWTSGGVIDGELILAANGGHSDYSGNEVYGCDFKVANPIWVRFTDPSTNINDNDVEHTSGAYPDGLIRSFHGYGRTVAGNGRIWCQPQGTWKNGWRQTSQWSFNRTSLGNGPFPVASASAPWVYHGETMPTWGGNIETQGGPSVFDKTTGIIWHIAYQGENSSGQSIWRFNTNTLTSDRLNLTLGSAGNGFPRWAVIADDLRLLIIGCEQGFLMLVDLNSPTVLLQKSTTGSPTAWESGVGAVYHQPSRSVLCWNGYGSQVRKLKIPPVPSSGTWTWSGVTAAGGSATPTAAPVAGAFGKFNMIDDMGNGHAALVVVNKIDESSYIYRLPVGELS